MKRVKLMAMLMCFTLSLSACDSNEVNNDNGVNSEIPDNTEESGNNENNENNSEESVMTTKMRITVNGRTLTATLEDNATTRALAERLPMTLPMLDLYNREMCYRFPEALPTDNARTRGYEVGEIVYYPPMHSFVIMYAQNGERFQMQTIGRIDSGVEVFNRIGNVDVLFEKAD